MSLEILELMSPTKLKAQCPKCRVVTIFERRVEGTIRYGGIGWDAVAGDEYLACQTCNFRVDVVDLKKPKDGVVATAAINRSMWASEASVSNAADIELSWRFQAGSCVASAEASTLPFRRPVRTIARYAIS
jgi:hypothetical protein